MLSEESLTQNSAFMAILSGLGATSTYNLYRTSQTYNLINHGKKHKIKADSFKFFVILP